MSFSPASKVRLTSRDLARFPGNTLFERIARSVCAAGCLPRKELYESWEMARRVRRVLRGGPVVDVAGGHGLLAHILLILDDTSPSACVVDPAIPHSSARIHAALVDAWPRLDGRVTYRATAFDGAALAPGHLVVSCHACGALTDTVLDLAAGARARVAVLPCCHDEVTCNAGVVQDWLDPALAIDVMRATRLSNRGYRVWTQSIPAAITPKNRLLMGEPLDIPGLSCGPSR